MRSPVVLRDRFARSHLALLFALIVVTAIFSYGYFHTDEVWQVEEFALAKLRGGGAVPAAWEYGAAIRPWLQPALYTAIGRPLSLLGVTDAYALAMSWRLFTGLLSFIAIALFLETSLPWADGERERRAHIRIVTLMGFLPYLGVRPSSEALSAAAFTMGLALLLRDTSPDSRSSAPFPVGRLFIVGVLFGVAFEARFQAAILVSGVVLWLLFVSRAQVRAVLPLVVGGVAVLVACLFIDAWGYGRFVFPPSRYFQVNLTQGVASSFGTMPFYAYFYAELANVFAPVVLVLLVAMVVTWFRYPRHALTWATLPFFLVHSAIAHKEERFLFPMAMVATAFPLLAATRSGSRFQVLAATLRRWSKRPWLVALGALANGVPLLVLALFPLDWQHHAPFERFVYETCRATGESSLRAYSFAPAVAAGRGPFMTARDQILEITPNEAVRKLDGGERPLLVVAESPRLHTGEPTLDARAELLFTEAPLVHGAVADALLDVVERYNAWQKPPLHPVVFRSVYRIP